MRVRAFASKEIVTFLRQPKLIIALVLGPFAILALFGLGYMEDRPPMRAVLVVHEQDGQIRAELEERMSEMGGQVVLTETTESTERAIAMVQSGEVDLAIVAPRNPYQKVRNGEQAVFRVLHNTIDPVEQSSITLAARLGINSVNRELLSDLVAEGQNEVGEIEGAPSELSSIPPEVLVSPLRAKAESIGGAEVGLVDYYAPGVIALLIQHLAITFGAFSFVRERDLGATEAYRVAPLGPSHLLIGKYIGFTLLSALIAVGLSGLMFKGFGLTLRGSLVEYATVMGLLILASLGIGFVISAMVSSDTQAVNIAMIILLVSTFFSGFFLTLDRLVPEVHIVSWLLPITHALDSMRDLMFNGPGVDVRTWFALGSGTIALYVVAWALFRRELRGR